MNIKTVSISALAIVALGHALPGQAAKTRYITDDFEVMMRSGTSISNSIVRMLNSGQPVTVLEEDLASKYSLVEIEDGKTGYVLNRYLVDTVSAKQRLEELQKSSEKRKILISSLQADVERLENELNQQQSDNEALKNTLLSSENELSRVKDAASDTLGIVAKNESLGATVTELSDDKLILTEENAALRDSTKLDWLVRGGGVSLVAFIIGIVVTRIRWKKQDSWGSY